MNNRRNDVTRVRQSSALVARGNLTELRQKQEDGSFLTLDTYATTATTNSRPRPTTTTTATYTYAYAYDTSGSGHVWQGRLGAFVVEEDDEHLYTLLRYVERNPLRANLVEHARDWPWGTLAFREPGVIRPSWLAAWPIYEPPDWMEIVNRPETDAELKALRRSVEKDRPFGSDGWARKMAARLGLTHTLRGRGRPRKESGAAIEQADLFPAYTEEK